MHYTKQKKGRVNTQVYILEEDNSQHLAKWDLVDGNNALREQPTHVYTESEKIHKLFTLWSNIKTTFTILKTK